MATVLIARALVRECSLASRGRCQRRAGFLLVITVSANPKEEALMKTLVSTLIVLGLVAGAAAPAFAAETPRDKTACEKAHMKWDDTAKKCGR